MDIRDSIWAAHKPCVSHNSYQTFITKMITGAGVGAGTGGSISFDITASNAKTVNNLSGTFLNANFNGGDSGNFGINTFNGPSDDGYVTGIGLSGGVGLGGASFIGPTYTIIEPLTPPEPSIPNSPSPPIGGQCGQGSFLNN